VSELNRILVTGGAGMIGSWLVEELVAAGGDVVVVDDLSRGRLSNLAAVSDRIELRIGDLEDTAFATSALADAGIVYHLASRAYGVGYGNGRHLEILRHNEAVTNNVLTALAARPPRKLLVTSSSCVYPDDGPDTIPELPLFTGEPERVNRGYGWAKRFLEQKATLFGEESGVPIVTVRPFNIYSERYNWAGESSQAIPMLVKRILDGNDPIIVWGSGDQRRSYVHALDCARMMVALMAACDTSMAVNIGVEETVSVLDLTRRICAAAGIAPQLRTDPTKPEGRFVKSADMSRFRNLVGDFELSVSFDEGIRRMVDWYAATDFSAPAVAAG
jgi:nucleoside-diphosphate-sugar epimerase